MIEYTVSAEEIRAAARRIMGDEEEVANLLLAWMFQSSLAAMRKAAIDSLALQLAAVRGPQNQVPYAPPEERKAAVRIEPFSLFTPN